MNNTFIRIHIISMSFRNTLSEFIRTTVSNIIDGFTNKHDVELDHFLAAKKKSKSILKENCVVSGGKYCHYTFPKLVPVHRAIITELKISQSEYTLKAFAEEFIESMSKLTADKKINIRAVMTKSFINFTLCNNAIITMATGTYAALKNGDAGKVFKNYAQDAQTQKIVLDYSSPNIAKEMHIGHLRSTIIGDTLCRLLSMFYDVDDEQILCLNHLGDWGTQFGMIIQYLRTKYDNYDDIIEFLHQANSAELLEIYRAAKAAFDLNKDDFKNKSRNQTFYLQQGHNSAEEHIQLLNKQNLKFWEMICRISSAAYNDVYKKLGILNWLTERGESYYNPFIPDVINALQEKGLVIKKDGAQMIQLEHWPYPLIITKSDGGYTYATTDITALWHRTQIEKADQIICITDKGQWPHFQKVFEVGHLMEWCEPEQTQHIGFGLVSDKSGKKLKTRSGDFIKLVDVITEVTEISKEIIEFRAAKSKEGDESIHKKYATITPAQIDDMSRKIGINTLKYYDLSHKYKTDYSYNPKIMFGFQGDTGVYQMYCHCRMASIISKSKITEEETDQLLKEIEYYTLRNNDTNHLQLTNLTKLDYELMFQLGSYGDAVISAFTQLNIKPVMDYAKALTTAFNRFVSKQNVKILGAEDEAFRVLLCQATHRVLSEIFYVIGFEEIDFI